MYRIYEDLRYGFRLITSNRPLALGVFLSLSLGIGVSTTIFSLTNAVLFRTLPAPEPDRVVQIADVNPASAIDAISYADFQDLRKRASTFETLATTQDEGVAMDTHTGALPRMTLGLIVDSEFFRLMRLQPAAGRTFRFDEDIVPDRDAVAMISYDLWQRDFDGRADAVGKTIRLNAIEFTIIGVMPESFNGINQTGVTFHSQFAVPRSMVAEFENPGSDPLTNRNFRSAAVYGRLKQGVTLEQARTEVERVASQLAEENSATNRGQSMAVYTLSGFRMAQKPGNFSAAMISVFLGLLVLGIACVNVGNLMLSAAPARTRETAVRLAMGASPSGLVRQFVFESCILAGISALSGLGIAALAARYIDSIQLDPGLLPIGLDLQIDYRVALFALVTGLAAGLLSGLIPALRCSRGDLNQLMRSADPHVSGSRTPFRRALVAGQVAVAALGLVLSGLALQSLLLIGKTDPGFRVNNVLTMAFSPVQSLGYTVPQSRQFYQRLVERTRTMPGVQSAALAHHVPLGVGAWSQDIVIDGYAMPEGQHAINTPGEIVGEGYFETLGISVLRGRPFDQHDTNDSRKVVIINQTMADKYWPGRDAIGKRIELHGDPTYSAEVVGIARTVKYHDIVERPHPFMYLPMTQTDETFMYLVISTQADAASFLPAARNAVRAVDPAQPIYDIHSLSEVVRQQSLFELKIKAQLAAGSAVVAVLLAVFGLYGILSYSVSRRRREIGIRIAVGATNSRVFGLIIRDGLTLSSAGIVLGMLLASAASSANAQAIAPADPKDPLVYGMAAMALVVLTLLSCYFPARRATQVDPNVCLRSE